MRIKKIFAAAGIATLLSACASAPGYDYTAFEESRPRSILVMPPVNKTTDVDAPLTFLATSIRPLAEAGYYVIPPALSTQTFLQNGVTVADEAHNISHSRLRQIFGADAALYIVVTRYGSFLGTVEVEAEAKLVDLRSGVEIWNGKAYGSEDSGASAEFGLIGLIASVAVSQIVNVLTDRTYDVGRDANYQMLCVGGVGLLPGPYHPHYTGDD